MGRVVIGMDPHKRSATIEVLNEFETVLSTGRFGADREGYSDLLAAGRRWPNRVWAVEGCQGVGRHLAQRLVADAHSVAVVALRTPGLRAVQVDDATVALRLLVDRRDELGAARTVTVNRLHRLLVALIPGGAKTFLSATQAKALLATVRPREVVGKTRRKLAAELIVELDGIDKRIKAANKELSALVEATGSTLLELNGIGPSGAARLLGDIGDVARFPTRGHLASWNGTAPIDASSGEQTRHRLSRAGNRRINRMLHIMAIVQLRNDTEGRAYYRPRSPPARPRWRRCGRSNGGCPTSSTVSSSTTRNGCGRRGK
jgi:transposase